ncbi:MAG: hypothetical protein AAF550_07465 [Myxococcota bacterium]
MWNVLYFASLVLGTGALLGSVVLRSPIQTSAFRVPGGGVWLYFLPLLGLIGMSLHASGIASERMLSGLAVFGASFLSAGLGSIALQRLSRWFDGPQR